MLGTTVRVLTSAELVQLASGWLLWAKRRNIMWCLVNLALSPPQFGAAGIQRFTAADDRCAAGDGPWHLTNKSAVHGRSARR